MKKAVTHLTAADPVLARIIQAVGPCRIQYREPVFDTLVRSIIYQQLSGAAAATIYGRLEAATGNGGVTPRRLARFTREQLRSFGISPQKQSYLADLIERRIDFAKLPSMTDEEVVACLTQVKGVGVWTAQMFLIFALRRPDILPVGDLGVRNAVKRAWGLAEAPTAVELEELGRPWRPWASIASWYLWRSLEGPAAL